MYGVPALSASVREYFAEQKVKEVKTPCLLELPTAEPNVSNFSLVHKGYKRYLRTSPESALKQIVCRDACDIFELATVFRADEVGKCHLQEFTMVEWYRVGMGYKRLMKDVSELLHYIGLSGAITSLTYDELFRGEFGFSCHNSPTSRLKAVALDLGFTVSETDLNDRDVLFDFLDSHLTSSSLSGRGLTFVFDYPSELRCYSELTTGSPTIAKRFELFADGLELANGYQEILSAKEQRDCFISENKLRAKRGLSIVPLDNNWLCSLANANLKKLSGVALGLERVLMKIGGIKDIRQLDRGAI